VKTPPIGWYFRFEYLRRYGHPARSSQEFERSTNSPRVENFELFVERTQFFVKSVYFLVENFYFLI
jgi:hypothetical protein